MTDIPPIGIPEHIERMETDATELQKELIGLAEKYVSKIPPDVVILAFASVTGKLLNFPNFEIKKARLKTLIKQKVGLM